MLATIASLQTRYEYPVKDLHDGWILMCLNMDRNTLWGSAGGMVFVDPNSWDARDRFDWVERTTSRTFSEAGQAALGSGSGIGLFNPLNWQRNDPVILRLPDGTTLDEMPCETLPGGSVLCLPDRPPLSVRSWKLLARAPEQPRVLHLPGSLETLYYTVRIDPQTGAILSLKSKGSGREFLSGPANVIVAERPSRMRPHADPGDFMPPRPERLRLAASTEGPSTIKVMQGRLATTVEVSGRFYGGGAIRRAMRFYNNHPRIDFETELNDVPNFTVVVAEFPLAEEVTEIRRGIPFGFSHGAWSKPNGNLPGWTKGIVPAVRWIDYQFDSGGGFALLDRGCSGREINGRTPVIYLLNAEDKYNGYPNSWLSGKGRHVLPYSIVIRDGEWRTARIPHMAWEYNSEPMVIHNSAPGPANSFAETSPNIIVEAMRREGDHIELRAVECLGLSGNAVIKLNLPHTQFAVTDALGRKKSVLSKSLRYEFSVRPQQIITMHLETTATLPISEPMAAWDLFVPKEKLPALHSYDPNLIGHPPFGG